MADFNQDPLGQATTTLSLPIGLTVGTITGTISTTIYDFAAESSDTTTTLAMPTGLTVGTITGTISFTVYSFTAESSDTTSIGQSISPSFTYPTTGQIWPLGITPIT